FSARPSIPCEACAAQRRGSCVACDDASHCVGRLVARRFDPGGCGALRGIQARLSVAVAGACGPVCGLYDLAAELAAGGCACEADWLLDGSPEGSPGGA